MIPMPYTLADVAMKAQALQPLTARILTLANCVAYYLLPFAVTYIAALPYILNGLESRSVVRHSCVGILTAALCLHVRANILVWREDYYPWVGMFLSMVLCGVQWIVIEAVLGLKQRATSNWLAREAEESRRKDMLAWQDNKQDAIKEESTILELE